jgi:hypothetical protein
MGRVSIGITRFAVHEILRSDLPIITLSEPPRKQQAGTSPRGKL